MSKWHPMGSKRKKKIGTLTYNPKKPIKISQAGTYIILKARTKK